MALFPRDLKPGMLVVEIVLDARTMKVESVLDTVVSVKKLTKTRWQVVLKVRGKMVVGHLRPFHPPPPKEEDTPVYDEEFNRGLV